MDLPARTAKHIGEAIRRSRESTGGRNAQAEAKGRASLAAWIHERHPVCRHITNRQVEDLLVEQRVTVEQVDAAGLGL